MYDASLQNVILELLWGHPARAIGMGMRKGSMDMSASLVVRLVEQEIIGSGSSNTGIF